VESKEAWVPWRLRFWKASEADAPAIGSNEARGHQMEAASQVPAVTMEGPSIGCRYCGGDGRTIDRERGVSKLARHGVHDLA